MNEDGDQGRPARAAPRRDFAGKDIGWYVFMVRRQGVDLAEAESAVMEAITEVLDRGCVEDTERLCFLIVNRAKAIAWNRWRRKARHEELLRAWVARRPLWFCPDMCERLAFEELSEALRTAMRGLSELDRRVVRYHLEGISCREIGRMLTITHTRVLRIIDREMPGIRRALTRFQEA